MDFIVEPIQFPSDCNIIYGQSHFIKTVEDLYEIMVSNVPNVRFGLAFNEASGPCLVRKEGNDNELMDIAVQNQKRLGVGHSFLIIFRNAFPINFLNAIKNCAEVVAIYCATANPTNVILAQVDEGRGVVSVIDGNSPKGIELDSDIKQRKQFLRDIGYKRSY